MPYVRVLDVNLLQMAVASIWKGVHTSRSTVISKNMFLFLISYVHIKKYNAATKYSVLTASILTYTSNWVRNGTGDR